MRAVQLNDRVKQLGVWRNQPNRAAEVDAGKVEAGLKNLEVELKNLPFSVKGRRKFTSSI